MFTTDRKGDVDNLKYGSIDKHQVPRYHTAGYGSLIGLGRQFRVSHLTESKRLINDESLDSSRNEKHAQLLARQTVESESVPITPRRQDEDALLLAQAAFIPLTYDNDPDRAVANIATDEGLYIDKTGQHSEVDAFDRFRNHEDNRTQIELKKQTEACPQDIEPWQKLIGHQEKYLRLISSIDRKALTAAEQNHLTDLRVSLYQKALTNVSSLSDRIDLIEGMMREGSVIWDTDRQFQEWIQMLHTIDSLSLQIQFLNFQQHNPIIYNYEKCLQGFVKLISTAKESESSAGHLVYLTLRVTSLMYASGYAERATAIWQALLEINFLTVSSRKSCSETMKDFETFWESEAPRLGEDDSKGWQSSSHLGREPQQDDRLPTMDKDAIGNSWGKTEDMLSRKCIMSARSLDETAEDDPYRVVLFSDIKDFIFKTSSAQSDGILLLAFLQFCGLPPLHSTYSLGLDWWKDAYLSFSYKSVSNDSHQTIPAPLPRFLLSDAFTLTAKSGDKFASFGSYQGSNVEMLDFASNVLTQLANTRVNDDILAEYVIALKFYLNPTSGRKYAKALLKKRPHQATLYNSYALLEVRLGNLEAAYNVWSTAVSMAASFEQNDAAGTSVVLLWHDWIWELLENRDFERGIQMVVIALPSGRVARISDSTTQKSLQITEDDVLRAKQFLNNKLNASLNLRDQEHIVWYTNLLAILNYLVSDRSLHESLRVFDSTTAVLTRREDLIIIEYIHQSRARLIDLHKRTNPLGYRPAEILSAIRVSQDLFPENSIFHDLSEQYSRQSGLIDRLRTIGMRKDQQHMAQKTNRRADTDPLKIENIAISTLNLTTELSRPSYIGGTTHSIRAAFRRATESFSSSSNSTKTNTQNIHHSSQHSPLIWSTWLTWELSVLPHPQTQPQPPTKQNPFSSSSSSQNQSNPKTSRQQQQQQKHKDADLKHIKDIYMSALRNCPWDKGLYLLGFTHPVLSTEILNRSDLRDLYRSMLDRGMRVRVEIDVDSDSDSKSE